MFAGRVGCGLVACRRCMRMSVSSTSAGVSVISDAFKRNMLRYCGNGWVGVVLWASRVPKKAPKKRAKSRLDSRVGGLVERVSAVKEEEGQRLLDRGGK